MPPFSLRSLKAIAVIAAAMTVAASCAPASPSAEPKPAAQAVPTAAVAAAKTDQKPAATAGAPKSGGVLRVGVYQEPIILNPYLGRQTIADLVTRTIIEGLLGVGPDGNSLPVLATEVPTVQNGGLSADGLTVTWKLRQGVTWSDGKPFSSKDILFTYNVIMNPQNPVVVRSGYTDIDAVTAPDAATVIVKYKRLYAAWKEHFGFVLPEQGFGGDTLIEKKDFNRAPVGTGPFKFKSWASGDNITLERNPNFREKGKPYLDGLIFKITPSREAAVQAFKVGEIDALWNLIEANIPEFTAMTDALIQPAPSDSVERLILNASCPSGPKQGDPTCPHPVLGDTRVRQAIELAIDKKSIVDKLLFGKTTVASSVIPTGWYAPQLQQAEFNPTRAKQLLDEAGWKPAGDGVRAKAGVQAKLEYGTTTGDRLREQTQQVIQEMLKAVGIEVEIKNTPSAVLLGVWQDNAPRARGNFDMLMWTTNAGADPQSHLQSYFDGGQIPTEESKGGRNYHRIKNPEIDKALLAASATVDETVRKVAYRTIAEQVNVDRGHLVLYNRLRIDAFKTYVKGSVVNIWSDFTWNAAEFWLDK